MAPRVRSSQYININCILFTGKQLDHILGLSKRGVLFLHLDATGKLVKRIDGAKGDVLYYALILAGGEDMDGPLPIAEFISTVQSTHFITIFLSSVMHALKVRTGCKGIAINKIEVDFYLASIQSIMKACNDTNLANHLKYLYDVVLRAEYKDKIPNFTVVHICSVHILRAVTRKLHQIIRSSEIHQVAKMFLTQLIHADTMQSAETIFNNMVIVFGNKLKTNVVDTAMQNMESMYCGSPNIKIEADDSTSDQVDVDDPEGIEAALRHGSPFYKHVQVIMIRTMKENNSQQCGAESTENIYYLPSFLEYILEHYMPFFPLWSALVIRAFGILRDSNQPVENWFKNMKYLIFPLKSRIQVARFVQALVDNILPRLLERTYSLNTELQQKNKLKTKKQRKRKTEAKPKSPTLKTKQIKKKKKEKKSVPWDLASEGWNGGKRNYFITPKNIDQAKEVRHDGWMKHVSQNSQSLTNNVIDECKESSEPTDTPDVCMSSEPRFDVIKDVNSLRVVREYPPNFPNIYKNAFTHILDAAEWKSLLPNTAISDGIINSFMAFVNNSAENSDFNVLCFDTFFATQIIDTGRAQKCRNRWAQKAKVWTKPVCLIPVNSLNNTHWSLLVLNFTHECIIYLDSLHAEPDPVLIRGVINFAEIHCKLQNRSALNKWVTYAPKDIPHQNVPECNTFNNCGAHMMTWVYVIWTSSFTEFHERDMTHIRKGIAHILYNIGHTQGKVLHKLEKLQKEMLDAVEEESNKGTKIPLQKIYFLKSVPMGSNSTLEYFASLRALIHEEHGYQTRSQTS